MGKNKKDLLKKKLIAQQMAQAGAQYSSTPAKAGEKAASMPAQAIKSKVSAIPTDEYSFVIRDVKKIITVVAIFLAIFIGLYYFDQKMSILTKLANWIFEKLI